MLEPERPEAVSPDRALCLPTFSHLLIVNKTFISLARSLTRSLARARSLSLCLSLAIRTELRIESYTARPIVLDFRVETQALCNNNPVDPCKGRLSSTELYFMSAE